MTTTRPSFTPYRNITGCSTEERIRLLDFERTVNEVFNPENTGVITSSGIDLGIAGRDVEYLSDLKNNCVAFVRQGALWEYQTSGNKMVEVFSFPQQSNSDARDTYMQNDIQIVNIDEAGNMYFLVSGYMNRGRHEGESGVAVYYFNATDSSITECLQLHFHRPELLLCLCGRQRLRH